MREDIIRLLTVDRTWHVETLAAEKGWTLGTVAKVAMVKHAATMGVDLGKVSYSARRAPPRATKPRRLRVSYPETWDTVIDNLAGRGRITRHELWRQALDGMAT